ncbi:MAG: cysteine desulfurase family protein [Mariprofundus sp.]|nr:cysteine desulfurase family protein [Mariprofundus sp.]
MKKIYLDYNASTPIATEVAQAIQPYLTHHYGNPSSPHWAGLPAKQAVEQARGQIAGLLGCSADEIIFTSGGTESNNHAIKGTFFTLRHKGNHIITSQIEHPATINPCHFLETLGAEVTYLPVDAAGMVNPDDVAHAITERTILVSVMHANNEVGTIQPIADISRITREKKVWLHTDAAQSLGKIPTNVSELGVDFLSLAGHKVYATKGVGALYIRDGIHIEPFMHGAGHESGRRAGTENVLLDIGLGAACELVQDWIESPQILQLRDQFWAELQDAFGDRVVLNGHPVARLPNTLNISFLGQSGPALLDKLNGVAASTGSACHAGAVELSPVLKAMGIAPEAGMGTIRFSLGRRTTIDEIEYVIKQIKHAM